MSGLPTYDLPGVLWKYWHACTCFQAAYRLAEAEKWKPPFRVMRVEYKHYGAIEINYATHMFLKEFTPSMFLLAQRLGQRRHASVKRVFTTLALVRFALESVRIHKNYRKYGEIDLNRAVRFVQISSKSIVEGKTERAYYIDGKKVG
jgi:hypothetical protein